MRIWLIFTAFFLATITHVEMRMQLDLLWSQLGLVSNWGESLETQYRVKDSHDESCLPRILLKRSFVQRVVLLRLSWLVAFGFLPIGNQRTRIPVVGYYRIYRNAAGWPVI